MKCPICKKEVPEHGWKSYHINLKDFCKCGKFVWIKKIEQSENEIEQLKKKVSNLQQFICNHYAKEHGILMTVNEILNIENVTLKRFHHYLINTDWNLNDFADGLYKAVKIFNNKPLSLIIPKINSIPDYKFRMKQMINSLSIIENITISNLIDKIQCEHKWNYQNAQGLTIYCEKCNLQTDPSGPPYLDDDEI